MKKLFHSIRTILSVRSIRTKLMIWFLVVSLIPLIVSTLLNYNQTIEKGKCST